MSFIFTTHFSNTTPRSEDEKPASKSKKSSAASEDDFGVGGDDQPASVAPRAKSGRSQTQKAVPTYIDFSDDEDF